MRSSFYSHFLPNCRIGSCKVTNFFFLWNDIQILRPQPWVFAASFAKFCTYGAHVLARQPDRNATKCKARRIMNTLSHVAPDANFCAGSRAPKLRKACPRTPYRGTTGRRLFLRWPHIGRNPMKREKKMWSSMVWMSESLHAVTPRRFLFAPYTAFAIDPDAIFFKYNYTLCFI